MFGGGECKDGQKAHFTPQEKHEPRTPGGSQEWLCPSPRDHGDTGGSRSPRHSPYVHTGVANSTSTLARCMAALRLFTREYYTNSLLFQNSHPSILPLTCRTTEHIDSVYLKAHFRRLIFFPYGKEFEVFTRSAILQVSSQIFYAS